MTPNHNPGIVLTDFLAALALQAKNPPDFTLQSPTHGTEFSLSVSKGKQP